MGWASLVAFLVIRLFGAGAVTCPPVVNQSCSSNVMCAFADAATPTYCVYGAGRPLSSPGTCTVATPLLRSDALFGSNCSWSRSVGHSTCAVSRRSAHPELCQPTLTVHKIPTPTVKVTTHGTALCRGSIFPFAAFLVIDAASRKVGLEQISDPPTPLALALEPLPSDVQRLETRVILPWDARSQILSVMHRWVCACPVSPQRLDAATTKSARPPNFASHPLAFPE